MSKGIGKTLLGLYVAVSVLTVLSAWQGWSAVHLISKPLMLISLSLWFFLKSRAVGNRFTITVQAGLFFSLIGDVALMFTERDEFFFLVGISFFAFAHLCYLVAFLMNIVEAQAPWQSVLVGFAISLPVLFGIYWYSGVLMPRVDPDLGAAIWTYLFIIFAMFCVAAFRWQRTYRNSWTLVVLGCLFFLASDALLCLDRFVSKLEYAPFLVLVPYAIGQFLIAMGCIKHVISPATVRQRDILNA